MKRRFMWGLLALALIMLALLWLRSNYILVEDLPGQVILAPTASPQPDDAPINE